MATPNGTTPPDIRRNAERRTPTVETLLRDSARLLEEAGVVRSPSWLSRTVRAYLKSPIEGVPFGMYLAARVELNTNQRREFEEKADLLYGLMYRDPTGETAMRNVDRERRGRA